MSSVGHEAMEKFWMTPELVEMLLPFLNAQTILNLAQSRLLNIQILQGPFVWNKLIGRTVPSDQNLFELPCWQQSDAVKRRTFKLAPLIQILKMMKDQKSSELDLLNIICERYPRRSSESSEVVTLSCSSNQTRLVSPLGFLLLEEVEGALGSTEQWIERIHIDQPCYGAILEGHCLSHLSSRVSRQQDMVQLLEIDSIDVSYGGRQCLDEFANLVDHCKTIRVQQIGVNDPLDDWSKLMRTLSSTKVSLFCFSPARDRMLGRNFGKTEEEMAPARREDLRAIWDLTEDHWEVYTWISDERYGSTYFYKNMGDADWKRFEQLLDMNDDELTARCDEWLTHEELGYAGGDGTYEEAEEQEGEEDEEDEEHEEDSEAKEDGRDEEND